MRGIWLVGLVVVGWGQTLRRNLVWNGGFEEAEQVVWPCSVWVTSPTGSRGTIPYPTYTPTFRWRGMGPDTLRERTFSLNSWPVSCERAGNSWRRSEQQVRAMRALDGSFLYGPLYFMPWQRVAAMCDSAGVEVWGWSLDTARILRDSGRIGLRLNVDPLGKPLFDNSNRGRGAIPPYYHPGTGLIVPAWSTPDTVSVSTYFRASYELTPPSYYQRGVWMGNTRKAFQGVQVVAPGWVAMQAKPSFLHLPENHEVFPSTISSMYNRSLNEIRYPTVPSNSSSGPPSHRLYLIYKDERRKLPNGTSEWRGRWQYRKLTGDGYTQGFLLAGLLPGAVGALELRVGYAVGELLWGEASPEVQSLYPYSQTARMPVPNRIPAFLMISQFENTHFSEYSGDFWFGEGTPYTYLLGYSPKRAVLWGQGDSAWAGDPYIVGYRNVVGRMPPLRSAGFVAPIQEGLITAAFGVVPRDSCYFPGMLHPAIYLFAPFASCVRGDSLVRGKDLRSQFLWATWGQRYYRGAEAYLYYHPIYSLGGQGWSYPVWHHKRIPYLPNGLRGGRIYVVEKRCSVECVPGGGCPVSPTINSVQLFLWDSLRWAMRPGSRCVPLAPYKGEGYMTISYPVREFHAFRTSEAYRQFLRGLSERFRIPQRLWGNRLYWMDRAIEDPPWGLQPRLVPCERMYPPSWCSEYFQTLQGLWDTVLNRASVRCGSPTFLTDFAHHFFWEVYMVAQDSMLRRVGESLGISRDSLRQRVFSSCCGAWWNRRTEWGGSGRYPYEQYKWRPVWGWGPQGWAFPTAGCPDRPELRLRGLDPECASHTFCAGRCPSLRFGFTPQDTFLVQAKWYMDSLAYEVMDSLDRSRTWINLLKWRFRGYHPAPWGWDYYFGCGRHTIYEYMYDSLNGSSSGWDRWLRRNPEIGSRVGWRRSGAPDMLHSWYWSYRYPEEGCFISFNHGPVETCCPDAPYRVNRAYALMGYLIDTLKAGRKYKVRMAVAVPEWSRYVINNVGVVVSREPIPNVYPYCREGYLHEMAISWEYPEFLSKSRWASWENRSVRLDSVAIGRWVVLEGELVAKGGEKFIYVGWLDSTRLDTVFRGEVEPIWQNGWLQRCLETSLVDWVAERGIFGADTGAFGSMGPIYQEPLLPMRWWMWRWLGAGEASLHIDEVELWEMDEPLGGRVEVEDGRCGGRGRGRVEVWGGVPPYRCFWDRPGVMTGWIEGCTVEGLEPGWWRVRVIDSTLQELIEWVEVRTTPEVQLELVGVEPVRPGAEGRAIVRVVGGTPPYRVWWSPSGVVGETLEVARGGRYVAWVQDSVGCVARLEVEIPEEKAPEPDRVWVPTAFSPNGDGVNDVVAPVVIGAVRRYRWRVYNRWGEVVFESQQVGEAWRGDRNGIPVPEDAYVWVLEVEFIDQGGVWLRKGTVTVVR